jgi:hypothetical protein
MGGCGGRSGLAIIPPDEFDGALSTCRSRMMKLEAESCNQKAPGSADFQVNGCQAKLCCSAAAFVGPKIFLNKFRFLFSPFFKIIFKAVRSNWMLEFR